MKYEIEQVATCGCEIKRDGKVVAWSVDTYWAALIKEALKRMERGRNGR